MHHGSSVSPFTTQWVIGFLKSLIRVINVIKIYLTNEASSPLRVGALVDVGPSQDGAVGWLNLSISVRQELTLFLRRNSPLINTNTSSVSRIQGVKSHFSFLSFQFPAFSTWKNLRHLTLTIILPSIRSPAFNISNHRSTMYIGDRAGLERGSKLTFTFHWTRSPDTCTRHLTTIGEV